jgi:hypothetical protein
MPANALTFDDDIDRCGESFTYGRRAGGLTSLTIAFFTYTASGGLATAAQQIASKLAPTAFGQNQKPQQPRTIATSGQTR